jgi:hypothetical protein
MKTIGNTSFTYYDRLSASYKLGRIKNIDGKIDDLTCYGPEINIVIIKVTGFIMKIFKPSTTCKLLCIAITTGAGRKRPYNIRFS